MPDTKHNEDQALARMVTLLEGYDAAQKLLPYAPAYEHWCAGTDKSGAALAQSLQDMCVRRVAIKRVVDELIQATSGPRPTVWPHVALNAWALSRGELELDRADTEAWRRK